MKYLNLKAAIGTILCAGAAISLNALANEPSININSRTENIAPRIIVRSVFDFEKNISVKVKTDPTLLPSNVLIRMVSKIGMVDAHGVSITSGFDIAPAHNLVVGFSGGTSEIIKTASTKNGLQIITSFKDSHGNFVSPPPGSLAAYTIGGQKLCFDYKTITRTAPKMAFSLLLDRSGSMASVIFDVKDSAQSFLKALPSSAECAVISFNSSSRVHNKYYRNCNNGNFKLGDMAAQGGTDLYTPLLASYENLSQPYFKDYQKAVIIITDGQIADDIALRQKLQTAKKDILTFVYFLGQKENRHLTGLADAFLKSTSDIKTSLDQYFHSLSAAYRTQKVLSVKQCKGGGYANP